jgi:hypothetical protein
VTRFTSSVWYWSSPLSTEMVIGAVASFPTSPTYSTRISLTGADVHAGQADRISRLRQGGTTFFIVESFSDRDSKSRQKKRIAPHQIRGCDLVIDGYNVLITIEAGLSGRPLILQTMDLSGISPVFREIFKRRKWPYRPLNTS